MPGLNRARTARRPADVLIGLRGIAASKIELSNKSLLVCYTFGRLATSKPHLIAGTICGGNNRVWKGRHVGTLWAGRDVAFGSWLCKNAATRDDDRINVLPNRVQALEDPRARLILVELRKVILVASQFFEFLHSLGHSRRRASNSPAAHFRNAPMD